MKKFLDRIWDRPDLPATFRPFLANFCILKSKNLPILAIISNFKDFLCSKFDFGLKLFQIHNRWVSGASLDPKDVLYRFWNHFQKSKILDFVNFSSCYAVSYPDNHLTWVTKNTDYSKKKKEKKNYKRVLQWLLLRLVTFTKSL